jgi:CheY-like chemotaxis protein
MLFLLDRRNAGLDVANEFCRAAREDTGSRSSVRPKALMTPLRVLLIEDSEDDAQLVLRQLRRSGYDPRWERHENAVAVNDALDRQTWDLILCDYRLPTFSALAALQLLRERGVDLPVIVVSGEVLDEVVSAVLQAGARDYVLKDNLASLGVVVTRELRRAAAQLPDC